MLRTTAQCFQRVRREGTSCLSGLLLCDRRDCGNLALVVSGQGRVGLADIFFHQPVWLVGLSLSPAGLASGIITGRSG